MRIGFDAKRATHNFRGLGNYSRGLIEGLVKYHPSHKLFLYSPSVKNKIAQNWLSSLPNDVVELRTPPTGALEVLSPLWRSFFLATEIQKDQLDIFHGLSHEIPYFFKGPKSYKKVVTMHDLIFMRYPEYFPALDRLVYKEKVSYACKNADTIIAICEQTKLDLINLLGVDEKKILIHYQSCSPIFYQKRANEVLRGVQAKYNLPAKFILNVCAFEERKNQLGLIEAFSKIANQVEENLVFVGNGKRYLEEVREKIRNLNLESRILILNQVDFYELPSIYQLATLFCFPSFFEGFGIPITEALFSGIPVITSLGSCFPESAGPSSVFVDPKSIDSISNALLAVLRNKDLQEKMSSQGLLFANRFHMKESTENLMNCYQQILS